MARIRLTSLVSALALVFMSMVLSDSVDAQSTDSNQSDRAKTGYQFSYTPIYQFKTDLDSGGEFDVQRHFLRFDVSRFIDRNWIVGIGLSFVVVFATIVGATAPLIINRLGLDPTVMAAPLMATFIDIAGLTIYFLTAKYLLGLG